MQELIEDIRSWRRQYSDWKDARREIESKYGYDAYPGNCHVVPNHALMIMALLYAPDNFQRAQMIVNTSGWDTDCNAGNVGCLMGIMLGLDGLDAGPDWRGPIADRLLISSADGGNSINDAVRIAYYLTDLGLILAGRQPGKAPKDGARFHFSLPGSVQGFRPQAATGFTVRIGNVDFEAARALSISYDSLGPGQVAAATTPTFSPPEVLEMRTYDLMATPLVCSGQTLTARVVAPQENRGMVTVRLRARVYDRHNTLRDVDGEPTTLAAGEGARLAWRLPDFDGQPIAEIGVAIMAEGRRVDGQILLDFLRFDGAPDLRLHRPTEDNDFWLKSWVNAVSVFSKRFPPSFRIAQDRGEGIIIHGTRAWIDYTVRSVITVHLGDYGGVAVRVQGLRRYYAVRLTRAGQVELVRVRDDTTIVLASAPMELEFETPIDVRVTAVGADLVAEISGTQLQARDGSITALHDGGIGLFIANGGLSADEIVVTGP